MPWSPKPPDRTAGQSAFPLRTGRPVVPGASSSVTLGASAGGRQRPGHDRCPRPVDGPCAAPWPDLGTAPVAGVENRSTVLWTDMWTMRATRR